MERKIWIFAGEASGDIYGARLAGEIKKICPDIHIAGMGGREMKNAGVDILVDSTELGVVGIIEIFGQLFRFIKIFYYLYTLALKERPDAVVLIDYPGFNMMFAKRMYKAGIRVIWYISPQVWAWKKSRIPKLAKYCKKMLVIFPFEPEVYAHTNLDVVFTGHPLVEIVEERTKPHVCREPDIVVLLPGSRSHEVERLLEPMLETCSVLYKKHPNLKFVISVPREKIQKHVEKILNGFYLKNERNKNILPEFKVSCSETPLWLQKAGTGIAASGTITVEAAIAGLPLVVIYKLHPVTLLIARMIIKLFRGFFTMTNIIADKVVFEEYLQHFVCPKNLVPAMERILPGGERREFVEKEMKRVKELLSVKSGNASKKAAEECLKVIGL